MCGNIKNKSAFFLYLYFAELKRRLDDDKTPLPKRLCLAKNVVQSHHFPTAPKERIVGEWLHSLTEKNKLNSDELKNVLDWLSAVEDLTSELKSKLIQVCLIWYAKYAPCHGVAGTFLQYQYLIFNFVLKLWSGCYCSSR